MSSSKNRGPALNWCQPRSRRATMASTRAWTRRPWLAFSSGWRPTSEQHSRACRSRLRSRKASTIAGASNVLFRPGGKYSYLSGLKRTFSLEPQYAVTGFHILRAAGEIVEGPGWHVDEHAANERCPFTCSLHRVLDAAFPFQHGPAGEAILR